MFAQITNAKLKQLMFVQELLAQITVKQALHNITMESAITESAFIPGNLAQRFIDEHDEVVIERIGGKQGRTKGDIPGVRFQVIKVNDQPLHRLWQGKIEKGRR